jgi:ubiquinone/menaquinone biosynthesis C-methylase UbiE
VDYGCGPGAFIKSASDKIGEKGTLYAVDIQELAIISVEKIIAKHKLKNVIPMLSDGKNSGIPGGTADLIYALDMFHMVGDPSGFLRELKRIAKQNSTLIIEDGHQSRQLAREKILQSGCWEIIEEQRRFLSCKPL